MTASDASREHRLQRLQVAVDVRYDRDAHRVGSYAASGSSSPSYSGRSLMPWRVDHFE